LSAGPQDATFEIVLGDLPPSNATNPVHLQWFGGYEAEGFDPKNHVNMWTIYRSPWVAYPQFDSPDFNGGNVRVNETGHATLRFKAPSTYYICFGRVRYPHLHLRLCTGESYLLARSETIEFKFDRAVVRACRSQGTYKIKQFTNIAPIPGLSSSTTPGTTTVDATTLRTTTTGAFMQSSSATANDEFDWDALEFSPVYQCILQNKLYDYFATGGTNCVDTCPSDRDTKHGQCVRKSTGSMVTFDVSWSLNVRCDQACWDAKTSRSRHNLRLAAADHLKITFQEVTKVILRPGSFTSRRLQSVPVSTASLHVSVTTDRRSLQEGRDLLKTFLPSNAAATGILGLDVDGMQVDTGAVPPSGNLQPGEDGDEFIPIYNEAAGGNSNPSFGTSPTDELPSGVIIGGAAGVVVLGTIFAISMWYMRRQRRKFASDIANVKGKHVEEDDVGGEKVGAPQNKDENKIGEDELANPAEAKYTDNQL
jgi:hypothetical protein